jgi:C4-dicarboxylate-specific signal transduction histidine kinase
MVTDKPVRRMTLRQLLTHAEKCCRDLIEHVQTNVLTRVADFRDLSRPVRRRSHYPALVALQNALKKLLEVHEEAQALGEYLGEHLEAIREHASRERVNRM